MVTADLVLYDPASPPPRSEVAGKIAVAQLIPESAAIIEETFTENAAANAEAIERARAVYANGPCTSAA